MGAPLCAKFDRIDRDRTIFAGFFLDRVHLFHGLDKAQLAGVAERFVDSTVPAGTVIFKRGDKPDGFYLVYKGRVKVSIPQGKREERQLAYLVAGDYFGEEALFEKTAPAPPPSPQWKDCPAVSFPPVVRCIGETIYAAPAEFQGGN
jgi:CRP-like cAMP-binding protein